MADSNKLRLEYVLLGQVVLWDKNPKRHDIQGIWESIERYGFKDPPKFEPELNDGQGGIVEGNGRIVCLRLMRDEGQDPPRGILLSDGDWAVPVLFGVDAKSEDAAKAYAVDHNNLTMAGGDFDAFDMARMWNPEYPGLLKSLDNLPITVDEQVVEVLNWSLDVFDGPLENSTHTGRMDIAKGITTVSFGRFGGKVPIALAEAATERIKDQFGEDPEVALLALCEWLLNEGIFIPSE